MPANLTLIPGAGQPSSTPTRPTAPDPLHEAALAAVSSPEVALAYDDSLERTLGRVQAAPGRASAAYAHGQGWADGLVCGYLAAHADRLDVDLAEATAAAIDAIEALQRQAPRKLKAVKP